MQHLWVGEMNFHNEILLSWLHCTKESAGCKAEGFCGILPVQPWEARGQPPPPPPGPSGWRSILCYWRRVSLPFDLFFFNLFLPDLCSDLGPSQFGIWWSIVLDRGKSFAFKCVSVKAGKQYSFWSLCLSVGIQIRTWNAMWEVVRMEWSQLQGRWCQSMPVKGMRPWRE